MNELAYKARKKFIERIEKGLLGPGSDTWGLPDEEEIISDYPLLRYFTGVLFPESTRIKSQSELDSAEIQNETSDGIDIETIDFDKEKDESQSTHLFTSEIEETDSDKISHNHFYPTNIGVTICVDNYTKELDVEFSFGLYYQPSLKEVKIRISEEGFNSFFNENISYQLPFADKLKYDGEFMYLEKELDGYAGGGGKERSGDYKAFDKFKSEDNLKDSLAKYFVDRLEKLISGRKWKRKEIKIFNEIPIENTKTPQSLELSFKSHKDLNISYNVKTYDYRGKKYVKIQLINTSKPHPRNRFSNKNDILNSKCLFQVKIKIISDNILPYKDQSEHIPFDKEAETLNFIYRNVKSYGIGHNCSVVWDGEHPKQIETTFVPHVYMKNVKNDFDDSNDSTLNEALNIKNLSTFGLDKKRVIQNLTYFVELYGNWIAKQKKESNNFDEKDQKIAHEIITKQEDNLNRLINGIYLLNKNDAVFTSFQLANLAMFIQFIISNDKDFCKVEKELSEIKKTIEYGSLDFFRNYDFNRIGFVPKYRPFQLAFFLLSIEGIVNRQSNSRKEIVDLIWFPTGGGKTEAYLAVTAFTIIWRRLTNENNYDGTTVLMRYTLRLLTAQQFERASRLISTLEFLRKQKEYKGILKDEPITIGLWIGQASTPNKLKDAKKKLDIIENECSKENRNLVDKNVFQISSCPWCGTKLISKDKNGNWDYGFKISRNIFKVFCLNEGCPFHSGIPVQIIDELLYKNPPTLLFGTVDKFAMLSWQEDAYNFFNTHNDEKLPPDLIIQDELHLLSGPLGSVTGIFESVIELLCTKNGIPPKIIASTATTRNTNEQIKKLYGNRKVNIFPPTGLNHNDSFFTKESDNESKRLYIGFMPTGKTSLDTQLQLLAHLLIARLEVYSDKELKKTVNNYWTIVSYYNSLKDVGKIFNKVGDEITIFTGYLQNRLSSIFQENFNEYKFNYMGIINRTRELTSRIESERIKVILKELEEEFNTEKIIKDERGRVYLNDIIDLVLATNMISVGIDVSRLNIMLINGMPKNVAEYIQASSRIGRKTYGLVITLLDPNRAREKSYFEHFESFHQAYYKNVEPLSVTPLTENTINKMLSSLLVAFVRQNYPGELNRNDQAQYFNKDKITPLVEFIKKRFSDQFEEVTFFEKEINRLADDWVRRIKFNQLKKYDEFLRKPSERTSDDDEWVVMQSMREVDTNTFILIKGNK